MTYASLFSGIEGFGLAAMQMNWKPLFFCEIEKYAKLLIQKRFGAVMAPDGLNPTLYEDIKKTDFTPYAGQVDVLTGGFPCQPFSVAGLQKATDDARYLWPEMLRCIREVRPRYVVAENVPGILNILNGLVFEQVCADLESAGYSVQPLNLPAAGVNAWHRRERIWFVAILGDSQHNGHSTASLGGSIKEKPKRGPNKKQAKAGQSAGANYQQALLPYSDTQRNEIQPEKKYPSG